MKDLSESQLKEMDEFCGEISAAILSKFPMNQQSNVMRMIFERVRSEREKNCKENETSFEESKNALDQINNLFTGK